MTMTKTICFDVETGGVNPYNCAICSVSLKVVGSDEKMTVFVKPTKKRRYEQKALDINKLSISYLEEYGVSELEAATKIEDFIVEHGGFKPKALAHNIIFDVQFLNVLFMRHKKKLFMDLMHYHPIDTMILMRFLKDTGVITTSSVSLVNSYKYFFGREFNGAHSSMEDVIATEQVYMKILDVMNK